MKARHRTGWARRVPTVAAFVSLPPSSAALTQPPAHPSGAAVNAEPAPVAAVNRSARVAAADHDLLIKVWLAAAVITGASTVLRVMRPR